MAIFDSIDHLLDEGDVPYFSLTIVFVLDQNGKRRSCWHLEGEAPTPIVVGELEMLKLRYIADHGPDITKRIIDKDE